METNKLKSIIDYHNAEYGYINRMVLNESDTKIEIDNNLYLVLTDDEADDYFYQHHLSRSIKYVDLYKSIAQDYGVELDDFPTLIETLKRHEGRSCLATCNGVEIMYNGIYIYLIG